jgi:hypothetical protein
MSPIWTDQLIISRKVTLTTTNARLDLSSEGAPDIGKTATEINVQS